MPNAEIILASQSRARKTMLENAGLKFTAIPASLDETAIINDMQAKKFPAAMIALELSKRKALAISKNHPEALVIGSDQVIEFNGDLMEKSATKAEAKEKLKKLRGKSHHLISAVSVAKDGKILWSHEDEATLTMRNFSDEFLNSYCEKAGDALIHCVGGYELENAGAWLFENVKGDFFTVLGMPLQPLLGYLIKDHGMKP